MTMGHKDVEPCKCLVTCRARLTCLYDACSALCREFTLQVSNATSGMATLVQNMTMADKHFYGTAHMFAVSG